MKSAKPNLTPPDQMQLVEMCLPQVQASVRRACRKYYYQAAREEVDDFSQEILLSLLEQSARRLRSYDPLKAAFSTWLDNVVEHHVIDHLRSQKQAESWEHLTPEELMYPPLQEEALMATERWKHLRVAISQMTPREQQMIELCVEDELAALEICSSRFFDR